MRSAPRKSAPKVRDGKVQRKNRSAWTEYYPRSSDSLPIIDRERPGEGYRHLLTKAHIKQFIEILPDWNELSIGLHAVILARGNSRAFGWHLPGKVAICAWDNEYKREWDFDFAIEHRDVLDRLGVPMILNTSRSRHEWFYEVEFTETSARGFLLMHILLHELGHHHDRMTTKSRKRSCRGEPYAEAYANRYAEQIWNDYFREFGW